MGSGGPPGKAERNLLCRRMNRYRLVVRTLISSVEMDCANEVHVTRSSGYINDESVMNRETRAYAKYI